MAKKIIVLEKEQKSQFRVAFWLDVVPVERQGFYADSAKTSQYSDATTDEELAIKEGRIVEHVDTVETRGQNQTQMRATLQEMYANMQAELNARDTWTRYGTFWDGAAWTNTGVP